MENGFTMLFDSAIEELGRTDGMIYCVVKRFCGMRDGYCHASLETMASKTGLSQSSVWRSLQRLQADGYIVKIAEAAAQTPPGYMCKIDLS